MKNITNLFTSKLTAKNSDISLYGRFKIFFLVMLTLNSMQPYFLWAKGIIVCLFVVCLFGFQFLQYFYSYEVNAQVINKKNLYMAGAWLLIYCYLHIFWIGSIKSLLMDIFLVFYPTVTIILCPDKEKKYFLNAFTLLLASILSVSLIFYFMLISGIKLPSYKIYHPYGHYAYFDNYRFFIVVADVRNFLLPRFQSVFVEPGHLGMFCSFLLYANGFNLRKKRNIILLISLLLTMSLASYLLLVVGLLSFMFFKSKKKILAALILIFVVILGIFVGAIYYKNNPDSAFSTAILSRLQFDEEKGIKGNNRNTQDFIDDYNQLMDQISVNTIFGYGVDYFSSKFTSNSSYKVYIYEYGILGFILLLYLYLCILWRCKGYVYFGMLLLYIAAFIQRPYALWFCELYVFISAGNVLKYSTDNKEKPDVNNKNNRFRRFLCLCIK